MEIENLLRGLDAEQRGAVTADENTVVSAGAGSGKTRVLAARYAWLIMEKGYTTEEILTLTFTNKAAGEMYSRIYSLLLEHRDNKRAALAIEDFYKARISTIDSFLAGVARAAAKRFGISPDFTSDETAVKELALNSALPFALEHRGNPALRMLMADKQIRIVAEELFCETAFYHSSVSSPLDFDSFMDIQSEKINSQWLKKTKEAESLVRGMVQSFNSIPEPEGPLYSKLKELLDRPLPAAPKLECFLKREETADENRRREIGDYIKYFFELKGISFSRGPRKISDMFKGPREELGRLSEELESIAAYALQGEVIAAVFPLLDEFQKLFNTKKREAGILSFNDIAHLALDALSQYPDIRKVYKESFKALMIDEAQDNNGLQRDLILLLAENVTRNEYGMPGPDELSPGKLFFVGDEKQSIYRFRGADVSVFRRLGKELPIRDMILTHNYRSKPTLIDALNGIFKDIFLSADNNPPDYEALYTQAYPGRTGYGGESRDPALRFCFLDMEEISGGEDQKLSSHELEAAFIAMKIRLMVEEGYEIEEAEGKRPCTFGDFAVLERTATHQGELEKQFRNFNIPYSAGDPAGLFSDAPINDLYHFLSLLVFPDDKLSYAALLRSPFVNLSWDAFTVCMLRYRGTPFAAPEAGDLSGADLGKYSAARELYLDVREKARNSSVAELLTRLWYNAGYRYETIWQGASQIYGELFDFFFELARRHDARGKTLADFLDYFNSLMKNDERIKDLTLPVERYGGVKIMTIHKSKGLEFPVVFIYGANNKGKGDSNDRSVFFHEKWGITLNLPQPDELVSLQGGNFFFRLQREEERRKETAELRRLLYVAMTRAESALFVTASIPARTKKEREEDNEPCRDKIVSLNERLSSLFHKKKDDDPLGLPVIPSFLDLLLPALISSGQPAPRESGPGAEFFSVEAIRAYTREELQRAAAAYGARTRGVPPGGQAYHAAKDAAPFYEKAAPITTPVLLPKLLSASSLEHDAAYTAAVRDEESGDEIMRAVKRAGLEAADFGTIVHAYLSARTGGFDPVIPQTIRLRLIDNEKLFELLKTEALNMTEGFFNSELGRLSTEAVWRETEFPVLTTVPLADDSIHIVGTIDLVFEHAGELYLVDFKTDRREEPDRHIGQLAAYAQAAGDIFGKPVRSWLFYLRTSHGVELSDELARFDLSAAAMRLRLKGSAPESFPAQ